MNIDPEIIYSKYGRDIGQLQKLAVQKAEHLDFLLNSENQQELDDQIIDAHLLRTLIDKNTKTFAELAYMCERKGRINIPRDDIARLIGFLDDLAIANKEEILRRMAFREINWDKERPRERYSRPPLTVDVFERMPILKSIEHIIEDVYLDFSQDLNKCQNPCDRFRTGSFIDDYQDRLYQRLYLLRYLVAYSFENKEMYKDILCDLYLAGRKKIVITSLGCGSAIDYWSLQEVLNEYRFDFDMINYNGVDSLRWDYSFGIDTPFCKKTVVIKDAAVFLEEKEYLDETIIVFPRSIGDFSNESFRRICEALAKKRIQNDVIYCMISGVKIKEEQNLKRIIAIGDALRNNGFVWVNDYTYQCSDPNKGITAEDRSLRYPNGTYTADYRINVDCSGEKSESYCEDCVIKKGLMLTCKRIDYTIVKFERKTR